MPMMGRNVEEELRAHLIETDEEFGRLAGQHSEFARKLDALEALPHLTYDEQLEEVRLKKLKLRLKDQMEAIMSRRRSRQVA
jgi:uncharacterized protein YdcH (DUF465 family)